MTNANYTHNLLQQTINTTAGAAITAVSEVRKLLRELGGFSLFHQNHLSEYDQTGFQMRELMPRITDSVHQGQSVGYDPVTDEMIELDPVLHARVASDLHGALHLMHQKGFEEAKSGIRHHTLGRYLELADENSQKDTSDKYAGLLALHRVSSDRQTFRRMMDRAEGLTGFELHRELADMADDLIRESNYSLIPDGQDLRYAGLHIDGILSIEDLQEHSPFALAHVQAMGQTVRDYNREDRADQAAEDQIEVAGLEAPVMFKGQAMEIGQLTSVTTDQQAEPDVAEDLVQDENMLWQAKLDAFANNQPSISRPAPMPYQRVEAAPVVSDWELVKEQFLQNTQGVELTYEREEITPNYQIRPPAPGLG
jgi:hypothetical protein